MGRNIRRIVVDNRGKPVSDAIEDFEYGGPDGLDVGLGMDTISVETEKESVAIRIERQPLRQRTI